ncbi:hypothetical protein [uncultured Thiodictyon sp.]|uniref:hypothetical protein n=1 Tax=uncultured Thiodictyon sp. TaxID=1846217 RepID=UPI0025D605E3|nr:hypothetical protein [uncultured Thiodictyon sp.]
MNTKQALVLAVCVAVAPPLIFADDSPAISPAETEELIKEAQEFMKNRIQFYFWMSQAVPNCVYTRILAIMERDLFVLQGRTDFQSLSYVDCAKEKKKFQERFDEVMSIHEVLGNQKLVELVKDFHAKGVAIMMQEPRTEERDATYKRRMGDAVDQMRQLGARIAVEIGISPPLLLFK